MQLDVGNEPTLSLQCVSKVAHIYESVNIAYITMHKHEMPYKTQTMLIVHPKNGMY